MRMAYILLITVLGTFAFAFLNGYGLRLNLSPSLPHKLYFSFPSTNPQIGQIVSFKKPESSVTFAKVIVGAPGDIIAVENCKVSVNGIESGEILYGFDPIKDQIIPEGYYFLMGSHLESFDSRYAVFGLVPQEDMEEKLCPIF